MDQRCVIFSATIRRDHHVNETTLTSTLFSLLSLCISQMGDRHPDCCRHSLIVPGPEENEAKNTWDYGPIKSWQKAVGTVAS